MRSQIHDVEAVEEHLRWLLYEFIPTEKQRLNEKIQGGHRSRHPLGAGILRKTGFHLDMLTRDIEQRLMWGGGDDAKM